MASGVSGLGFDDVRTLSATSLLYASMLAEERLLLYGRGTTANGYVGPLGTPGSITLAAVSASIAPTSPTANTTALANPSYVIVAADAGDLQTPTGGLHQGPATVASTHVASVAVTTGQAIQVTVGTDVAGALGYNFTSHPLLLVLSFIAAGLVTTWAISRHSRIVVPSALLALRTHPRCRSTMTVFIRTWARRLGTQLGSMRHFLQVPRAVSSRWRLGALRANQI